MRRYVALLAAAVNIVFIVHRPGNFSRFDIFSALKSLKKSTKIMLVIYIVVFSALFSHPLLRWMEFLFMISTDLYLAMTFIILFLVFCLFTE